MPLYSVLTYDAELGDYTPHDGLSVPSENVPLGGVLAVLRELKRSFGYSCHRKRDADGGHDNNDPAVRVFRHYPEESA